MRTARNMFYALVQEGNLRALALRPPRRLFAAQRFAEIAKSGFRIDEETESLGPWLNESAATVRRYLKTFYRIPHLDDLDLYVGAVRQQEPNAACLRLEEGGAIIFWSSGISIVFPSLARLLQRMSAGDPEDIGLQWNVYVRCWSDLLVLARNPKAEAMFPEMFRPVFRSDPALDLPDYNQPQPDTFFQAIVRFLLGHELGHIFFESLQAEGAGLLADVGSGTPSEQALCEEMICDELGLYACIAGCLERWGGMVRDGKFAFTGGSSRGDRWGGARDRHNFEGFLADSMTAIWMLFHFQTAWEALGPSHGPETHPPAPTRIRALLSSSAGSLLGDRTSSLSTILAEYGRRLNIALGLELRIDDEQRLLSNLDKYRRALSQFFPPLQHAHWVLSPKVDVADGQPVIWFPEAFGGVYRDGIPAEMITDGEVIERGESRSMGDGELARWKRLFKASLPRPRGRGGP